MAIVKVWNKNIHPHTEMFKGAKLTVPANGFIMMEYEEAVEFAGQFTGVAKLAPNGKPDATQFKMISVERPPYVPEDDGLVNHATGKKASSHAELVEALKEFSSQRAPVDRDAEALAKSQTETLRAENAKLAAELAAIKEKRGPGRPRKEA